jgi:hypothetical protein
LLRGGGLKCFRSFDAFADLSASAAPAAFESRPNGAADGSLPRTHFDLRLASNVPHVKIVGRGIECLQQAMRVRQVSSFSVSPF